MNRTLYLIYTLFVIILLTACVPTAAPAGAPAAQNQADSNAFPVTIDHKYGSTTITATPERIVTVGLTDHDALLALGIVPVGTTEWFGGYPGSIWPWAQDEWAALGGAVPEAVGGESINFEKIAALQPDLILALYAGVTQEQYDLLAQIAPTVAQPADYVDYGIPWQALTLTVGKAVGQAAAAQALVDEVEAQFLQIQADHPEFVGASAVATMAWQGIYLYGPQDIRSRLLTALGFVLPEGIEEITGSTFGGNLSMERADLLDTDVIIWIDPQEAEGALGGPVYQALPVHTEGREVLLSSYDELAVGGATSFVSVLSLPYLLEKLTPMLVAALDGDPATTAVAPAVDRPAATFPVNIDHKFGRVTLEAEPQRVIALGYSEVDPILALGVKPIAVREWFGEQPHAVWPWAQPDLGDATPEVITMPFGELNFEALAAMQPDLIVATHSGLTAEEYATLAQIAPTLAQSGDYDDFGMPWQEQTRTIGQALGRSAQAEDLIAAVEAQIVAAANPAFVAATISWITPADAPGEFWVTGQNTPPLRFLAALGFQYPAEVAELMGEQYSIKISSERLDLIDTTVLILRTPTQEALDAILADPIFQQLNVVKEGRLITFVGNEPVYGALSFSTVDSLPFVVENLVPQLVAAVAE